MYRRISADPPFPDIVWPLNHWGYALMKLRPKDALPLLEEGVRIRQRLLPPGAHWRLVSELNLGLTYERLERWDEAEPLLLAVHEVIVGRYPPESPAVQASRRRLQGFYRRKGEPEEAARYAPQKGR